MPTFPQSQRTDPPVISTFSPNALAIPTKAMAFGISALSWLVANRAIFVPVPINQEVTIVKLFWHNAPTLMGNLDVGIYDPYGNLIVSTGSTLQSGTSNVQEANIPDTVLVPGLYYFGMVFDNVSGSINGISMSAGINQAIGVFNQLSVFPLPTTGTFSGAQATIVPLIGATQRVTV